MTYFSSERKPKNSQINSSNNTKSNRTALKNHLITLAIISLLVGSNFLIGSYQRTNLEKVLWNSDDVSTISVAHSFQKNKDFNVTFLSRAEIFTGPNDDVIKNIHTLSHQYTGKGPVYFILLGSFYQLLGTTPKDFYFHGSLFSNLTASIFLVLFFFFIKNKFNLKIAFFSSILVLLIPITALMSARVIPDSALLFVFSLAALFFLEKKFKHYFLFGIFAGLAHLTHPFGIFVGSAYCLFLLVNKEFKGFLITFASWNLVLLPWILRNYYFFKDVGWGLWLPFSAKISSIFSILQGKATQSGTTDYLSNTVSNIGGFETAFQSFVAAFQTELSSQYYMDYLIIFLILFSGFAFFKIDKLKVNKKYVLIPLIGIAYIIVYYNFINIYIQIVFAFVIPVMLVYLFYKRKRSSFANPVPRLYSFIIFFTFVNLIAYYLTATLFQRQVPETREILFAIFLLIPLALVGLDRFLRQGVESWLEKSLKQERLLLTKFDRIVRQVISKKKTLLLNIFPFLIMGLVLSPMMNEMVAGIESLNSWQYYAIETSEVKKLNVWIRDNIHDKTVASNFPEATFLRTGLESAPLPTNANQTGFEDFLDHFGISYLIFYDFGGGLDTFASWKLHGDMQNWPTNYYNYTAVYTNGHTYAIKAVNLIDTADISHPLLYVKKGVKLERLGEIDKAKMILNEIRNYQPSTMMIAEQMCTDLTRFEKFDLAIDKCNYVLNNDKTSVVALHNLAISYQNTGQREKVLGVLGQYNNMLIGENVDNSIILSWANLLNYLISQDEYYAKGVLDLLDNAKKLEEQGDVQKALLIYQKTQYIDKFGKDSLVAQVRLLTKLGQSDDALKVYDSAIKIYEKENTAASQKSLIDTLHGKATLLTDLKRYDDANEVYLDIIRLDMFDKEAHEKRVFVLEKLGMPVEAEAEKNFVERLELRNSQTQ